MPQDKRQANNRLTQAQIKSLRAESKASAAWGLAYFGAQKKLNRRLTPEEIESLREEHRIATEQARRLAQDMPHYDWQNASASTTPTM